MSLAVQTCVPAQLAVAHDVSSWSWQTLAPLSPLETQRSPAEQSSDVLHCWWHRENTHTRGESQSLLSAQLAANPTLEEDPPQLAALTAAPPIVSAMLSAERQIRRTLMKSWTSSNTDSAVPDPTCQRSAATDVNAPTLAPWAGPMGPREGVSGKERGLA
jgi:hypothetical protein